MHGRGYAHMDIKPHNVLIRRPRSGVGSSSSQHSKAGIHVAPSARQMMMSAGEEEEQEALADTEAGRTLVSWNFKQLMGC